MMEPAVVAALLAFCKEWKPHIKVFGGDLFDLRPLRRGCSSEDRAESIRNDVAIGLRFMADFSPQHYLRGNHCERLWLLAESGNGVEADYAQSGLMDITERLRRLKCEIYPYHKRTGILTIGQLKFLHGFHCGVTATRMHAATYGACLHGHTHTIDESRVPGLEKRVARSVGALCKLDQPYNSRMPSSLRHAHGWAYGVINSKTGNFQVWQAEEVDKLWLLPKNLMQIG